MRIIGLLIAIGSMFLLVPLVMTFSEPAPLEQGHVEPGEARLMLGVIAASALTSLFGCLLAACTARSPSWLSVTLFFLAMPVLLIGLALGVIALLTTSDKWLVVPALACVVTALIALKREYSLFRAGTP